MSTDQLAKSQGKTVQFGVGQITNHTPQAAKYVFRTILYLSVLWAVIAPVATEIPPAALAIINKYLLLSNGLINVTIQFFGWDFKR